VKNIVNGSGFPFSPACVHSSPLQLVRIDFLQAIDEPDRGDEHANEGRPDVEHELRHIRVLAKDEKRDDDRYYEDDPVNNGKRKAQPCDCVLPFVSHDGLFVHTKERIF
jgi:hypothetical protein